MENDKILAIYSDTVTSKAIADISSKHKGLVHDFSNEAEFKAARKVNTEMNKLLKQVDTVGIAAAKQVTEVRNQLKESIEDAYSGTVEPFKIEDQRRKDEANRIKREHEAKLAEQRDKISMMRSASQRALHLPVGDIEDIFSDVMCVDLSAFDDDVKQEASLAKDIAMAQLKDAMKFATEKEQMRIEREKANAIIGDKDDEIERLKAMLEAQQPPKKEAKPDYDQNELKIALLGFLFDWGVDNWAGYDEATSEFRKAFPGADIPR